MKTDDMDNLLGSYRMTFVEGDCDGVNVLYGLKDLINDHYKNEFIVAEIGSFAGVSTELFARCCKTVYSIDPYEPYPEVSDEHLKNAEIAMQEVMKRCPNISLIKKKSLDAVNHFENESLDAVYIDAAHDMDSVTEDIGAWLPKVKKGGVVSGHDGNSRILSIVQSYFPKSNIYLYKDSSWAVVLEKD